MLTQPHRGRAEEGRGAALRHPQERRQVRRRPERAAQAGVYAERRESSRAATCTSSCASWFDDVIEAAVDSHTGGGDIAEDWELGRACGSRSQSVYPIRGRDLVHDRPPAHHPRGSARPHLRRRDLDLRAARGRSGARTLTAKPRALRSCCRCWTLAGASTSTTWTTCARASACAAYAQKDPLVEYRSEGARCSTRWTAWSSSEIVRVLFHVEVEVEDDAPVRALAPAGTSSSATPTTGRLARGAGGAAGPARTATSPRSEAFPVVEQRIVEPGARRRAATTPAGAARARSTSGAMAHNVVSSGRARSTSSARRSRRSEPSCTGFVITFDPDALSARKAELEAATVRPDFWDDQRRAARVSARAAPARSDKLDLFERLQHRRRRARRHCSRWPRTIPSGEAELEASRGRPRARCRPAAGGGPLHRRVRLRPRGGDVHAGAGGTDSQDWAEMLLRMYLRWAEGRGLKTELLEATPGEEAGLKSATFTLTGDNAYGIMQAEKGVHRLVRQSPFDSAHRRHTSFAQVEVAPLVDDDVDVEIDDGRPADRHLPLAGRRRPARQQDRLGGAPDPPADRHRRPVPERALPAAEQGSGDAHPASRACSSASANSARQRWPSARGEAPGHLVREPDPVTTSCIPTRW